MKKEKQGARWAVLGSGIAVLGAAMAPCCFPLLGAAFGSLGFLGWQAGSPWITQAGVLLAVAGLWITRNRDFGNTAAILGTLGAGAVLAYYHLQTPTASAYLGLTLILAASLGPWLARPVRKLLRLPRLHSMLTCPLCGGKTREAMPTDSCLFFWECPRCHQQIRPLQGDCCVFCSYGSVPCPPMQQVGCSC